VLWVVPLSRCQLATLVRHRVLLPIVVRLRQDRCTNSDRVRHQHRPAMLIERAEHRRRGEHIEGDSKLACASGVQANCAVDGEFIANLSNPVTAGSALWPNWPASGPLRQDRYVFSG
jgi:hypothetical protein